MTRNFQFALSGLCLGLLFVIAAELLHKPNEDVVPLAGAAKSTTAGLKTAAPARDMEAMVDAILDRPLFSPTRLPPQVSFAAPIGETSENAQPLPRRLAGVMISPGVREALFVGAGQKPIAVHVGGEIDGWKIAAIEPDRVILSGAFGNQTVKPVYGPKITLPSSRAISTGLGPPQPMVPRATTAVAGDDPDEPAKPNIMLHRFPQVARPSLQGGR